MKKGKTKEIGDMSKPKDRKEFTHTERREEILKLIIKAGHPQNVSQTEVSKIYGVSQVMIHKDFKAIATQIKKELPNNAALITHVVFQSAIQSLSKGDNADKFKAAKLVKDWNDYLFDSGEQKKAPQKIEGTIQDNRLTAKQFADAYKANEAKKCGHQENSKKQ